MCIWNIVRTWFKKLKLWYHIKRLGIGKDYKIGSNKSKIK